MYSNSRLTRGLVFSFCITYFEMNFIATLCPVIVCIATVRRQTIICGHSQSSIQRTFNLSKCSLRDIFYDGILSELFRRKHQWRFHLSASKFPMAGKVKSNPWRNQRYSTRDHKCHEHMINVAWNLKEYNIMYE